MSRRHRPGLDDPELLPVVAPLDVLRHAVMPLDAGEQDRERGQLGGGQRRSRDRAGRGRAEPHRQHSAAFADMEFVGIDLSANERFTESAARVDDEFVRSGDGIDRERHAGSDRRHHHLHEHADARLIVNDPPRDAIRARRRRIRRATARDHCVYEGGALDVEPCLVDAGERMAGAVLTDAGRSHGEPCAGRQRIEPRVIRQRADDIIGGSARNREAVGHRKACPSKARATVGLAADQRQILGRDLVQPLEIQEVSGGCHSSSEWRGRRDSNPRPPA